LHGAASWQHPEYSTRGSDTGFPVFDHLIRIVKIATPTDAYSLFSHQVLKSERTKEGIWNSEKNKSDAQ
jgi:hypothetical protein